MKKILLILILIFAWQLNAQQRFYIISEPLAKEWKQYKICWYYGIDPVQLKTGEWIISEECYYDMTNRFIEAKQTADAKLRADSVRIELEKYPARIVDITEFKEPEVIEQPKIIPK